MAITFDNSAKNSAAVGVTTLSLSGTLTIGGTANLLLVNVGWGVTASANNLTDVTVAGSSILANNRYLKADTAWTTNAMYSQLSPASGTPTITATFSPSVVQAGIIGSTYIGVDVAGTPFGTAVTASSLASSTASTGTVTSSSGDWVVGGVSSDSDSTITENLTLVQEAEGVGSPTDVCFGVQRTANDSPTLTWSGGNNGWSCGGVPIHPSGGPIFTGLGMLAAMGT